MEKLYLPIKRGLLKAVPVLSDSMYVKASSEIDDVLKKIKDLEQQYLKNPSSVSQNDATVIIKQTYTVAIEMFEDKIRSGFSLLPEEQAILDLCRREVSRPQMLKGVLGLLFHSISRIRDVVDDLKEWFGLSSDDDIAGRYLAQAGDVLLPQYRSLIQGCFTAIQDFFTRVFEPEILNIAAAQLEAALFYQVKRTNIDKPMASLMLTFADFAYSGIDASKSGGYVNLKKAELPSYLQPVYDETKGLITSSRGLRAWLGKKDNNIVVSFSGTDSLDMVYADIEQLSAPSLLYLKSAGLLKIILDSNPGKNFYITGHSLGGGLTQFSLTANASGNISRMSGFGYNPAGLSEISMIHLKSDRMGQAKNNIEIFMTAYDPVSTFGGKLGCLITLPKSTHNGHGIKDLMECMVLYLNTTAVLKSFELMNILGYEYVKDDFIPYVKCVGLKDSVSENYWSCFNPDYKSGMTKTFASVQVSKSLLNMLQQPNVSSDYCAGVYNKFNGCSHSAANRLLLASSGQAPDSVSSTGDAHAAIIYGKFGFGKKAFVDLLTKAFVESSSVYDESRSTYEMALAAVRNPFPYELQAWRYILINVFGISNLDALLAQYPHAAKELESMLIKFASDKEDLFASIYQGRAPDQDQKNRLGAGLEQLAVSSTNQLLDQAVTYGIMSGDQRNIVKQYIADFCSQVRRAIAS
ncbi:hypothetical protein [Seleniivibrio sp.]|uniref:hypothetical protein n=1 Tax=Seleniivibrio sp. TaxID=2898801 RepID=UPI0025D19427|nr:hypothetical protein [Seleniivibrio sp.]MCD8554369.1 hypothetical protein [Seleniivibrio sp.]